MPISERHENTSTPEASLPRKVEEIGRSRAKVFPIALGDRDPPTL